MVPYCINAVKSHPFLTGLVLRLVLATLLPWMFDNDSTGVRYTDIDYLVFTDAARHVAEGSSPYLRHTYRYTPFLAQIMAIGETLGIREYFGRFLFCTADAMCGWLILIEYEKQLHLSCNKSNDNIRWKGMLWWLLNPLPINICTRGSAEAFVVLLPVLGCLKVALSDKQAAKSQLESCSKYEHKTRCVQQAAICGVLLGIAVHCKIYPIIYTISFMAHFSKKQGDERLWVDSKDEIPRFPWLEPTRLLKLIWLWIQRILMPAPLAFLTCEILTFGVLTFLAVNFHGYVALDEGILYHFSRVDHRHNYSMFWYWIYLARARAAQASTYIEYSSQSTGGGLGMTGKLLMIPQVLLIGFSSVGLGPYDLSFTLFIQTFMFVAHNKVITAQYFTWYLCLLPLCANRIDWRSRNMINSLLLLGLAFLIWLLVAYSLEMRGMSVFLELWLCSVFFFVANTVLFGTILENYLGLSSPESHTKME